MRDLIQDVRYAVRILAKAPGFTLVALITLALGIGANTAMFSVLDGVLLRPLPYAEPQQLMALWGVRADRGELSTPWSYPDFRDVQAQNRSFEQVALYGNDTTTLTGAGEPQHTWFEKVTANMFTLLRVQPALGRNFTMGEDAPGHYVTILSNAYWQSHYGGDPKAVGQTMVLDGREFTIVGVLPATFTFPFETGQAPGIFTSFSRDETPANGEKAFAEERGAHYVLALGRLRAGVTLAQANEDLKIIGTRLEKEYPKSNGRRSFRSEPAVEGIAGEVRTTLYILLGSVMLVLLIGCANIANLMLARGAGREREIGIRFALGATRGRVVRQLLIESGLLSLAGGLCGMGVAVWVVAVIRGMTAKQLPRVSEAGLDGRVLVFSFVVMMITGVLFGLMPALQLSRRGIGETLKDGGRSASGSLRQNRIKNALVVTEMIFAMMLLSGAGLLMKSLHKLQQVNPGFQAAGLATFQVDVPDMTYSKPQQAAEFFAQLVKELRNVPGITSVSAGAPLPLTSDQVRTTYAIEGRPVAESDQPVAHVRVIDPQYFQVMKIPMLQGRTFAETDLWESTPVVIINRKLAEQSFPGEDPIGKRIKPGISASGPAVMREIVGVVAAVKHRSLDKADDAEVYVPEAQIGWPFMGVVIRTGRPGGGDTRGGGDAPAGGRSSGGSGGAGALSEDGVETAVPAGLMSMVRDRVRSIDKDVPIFRVQDMQRYVLDSTLEPRMDTELLGSFAALAMVLAVVGIYGVISYGVSQRVGEIGIRMTLGAQRADVMKMVLSQGLQVAAIGVGIGAAAALGTNRLLGSLLFGVRPGDTSVFLAVIVVLMGSALVACYVPARRAMNVSPMEALRYE